ncbi:MAG: hypothetical protein ACYSWW_05890 [Planctomycetota bacterium]
MQTVIQAKVSRRLLSKADRLFTGTLDGRIIEILQNARRAGATEVTITNQDGLVTVWDNGKGIDDFSKLLDLGDSDWDDAMEKAEDPAGVGVFCLAPREVTISSGNKKVCITEKVWTGEPIPIMENGDCPRGTALVFKDEPWDFAAVEKHAVFTGLRVTVDGKQCAREQFCSDKAINYLTLGYKVEVREKKTLNRWHEYFRQGYYSKDILVNFHGQVIAFKYSPVTEEYITFLVDLTGDATDIRLMLPARTMLVENEALEQLKSIIEIEAYLHIQRRGSHRLPFAEYKRAKELGVKLPEAEPVFDVGLLSGDTPEPIEVTMPKDFPLAKCYRFDGDYQGVCETDDSNAHLLAAICKFKEPFVPVSISRFYDGYSWADLPEIGKVEVTVGKEVASQGICNEILIAVDSLHLAVHTTDGKVFKSDVPMAVLEHPVKERTWSCMNVYVTLEARSQLSSSDIWYHCGGWNDEGDTWGTQLYDFEQDLERFWVAIIGPGEYLRSKIRECLFGLITDWQKITFESDEILTVLYRDGAEKVYKPAGSNSAAT